MAQIKVTYNQTVRRFVVPETTTWAELERQLRTLFSIPSETALAVSYTDDDGDVITLSSDLELRELLGQQRAGTGAIRLRVVTDEDSNEESWVAESVTDDAESLHTQGEESKESKDSKEEITSTEEVIANVNAHQTNETDETDETDETAPLIREEQKEEERPRSYPSVTVVDEEDDPTFEPTSIYSSAEKGKQKEDAQKEDAQKRDAQTDDESEKRPPFLNLAQDFEVLLDHYHDIISRTPLLVDAANKVMDQILHGAKVDLEAMQALFESFRRPTNSQSKTDATTSSEKPRQKDNDDADEEDDDDDDDDGCRRAYIYIRRPYNGSRFTPSFVYHPFWNDPFSNGIFNFYGPRFVNPRFVNPRFVSPRFVSPRFVNPFSTPVFRPPFGTRSCGTRPTCCPCPNAGYRVRFASAPSSNVYANRCARTCQRPNGQQSSDTHADKLKQLESMGFTNRAENEDLLRRYNGRMSRVVEILVRQRNSSHQTPSTSSIRKIPIVDASASAPPSSSSSDATAKRDTDSTKEEKVSFSEDVSNSKSDAVQTDETSKFSQSATTLVNVDANGQVLPYSL